jgi:hypothetical protein
MLRKKDTDTIKDNNVVVIPKHNNELEKFIVKNKIYLTEQVLSSIEFAIENKLPLVEVYRFSDSDFVVTIPEKYFLSNVDHIYNFYLETENYELCSRVVKLQNALKNTNNYNEKEIEITGNI